MKLLRQDETREGRGIAHQVEDKSESKNDFEIKCEARHMKILSITCKVKGETRWKKRQGSEQAGAYGRVSINGAPSHELLDLMIPRRKRRRAVEHDLSENVGRITNRENSTVHLIDPCNPWPPNSPNMMYWRLRVWLIAIENK